LTMSKPLPLSPRHPTFVGSIGTSERAKR
jgi:hypothetical protein